MNYLVALLLWAGSLAGAFFYGVNVGDDHATAAVAREDRIAQVATAAAVSGAASAIAANKPKNVTIRQEVEHEIRTNTVYADCRHTADQLQRLNAALAGDAPEPADRGVVPKAGAPH